VAFLPLNVTSFRQPVEQGITEKVKTNIGAKVFRQLLRKKTRNCIKFEANKRRALFFLLESQSFRAKRNGPIIEKSFFFGGGGRA
jgi:hypothetical protein